MEYFGQCTHMEVNILTKAEKILADRVDFLESKVAELYSLLETNTIEKHVYSVKETAQILGRTPQAVYAMIDRGELKSTKIGHTKIYGNDLRKMLSGKM